MKKIIMIIGILWISGALYSSGRQMMFAGSFQFDTRILFNERPDFGAGGGGLSVNYRFQYHRFFSEVAILWEISGIGMQTLFPVLIGAEIFEWRRIALDGYAAFYPGFALFRPRPPFMIGGGAGLMLRIRLSRHTGIRFFQELRTLTCPEYSAKIAPYWILDMPAGISWYAVW
jgi:hypothetical protein